MILSKKLLLKKNQRKSTVRVHLNSFIFPCDYNVSKLSLLFMLFILSSNVFSLSENIKIRIPKPTFVLPAFTGVYYQRESTIAPHEEELAKQLKSILESQNKQQAIDKLDSFFELELSPAMLHLKGQVYFNLEQYDKAERVFKIALLRIPEFVRALSDLAKVYIVKENYQEARSLLAKVIALGEHHAENYGQLGFINMELYNAHSAVAMYQNALALDPENVQWQQGLLAALTQAGFEQSALQLLDEMLKLQPESIDLWLTRAFLYSKLERHQKSLASLEAAIILGNKDPINILSCAQLHLQLNSYERAIELFSQYTSSEKFEISMLFEAVQWLGQQGQWGNAARLLNNFEKNSYHVKELNTSDYLLQRAFVEAGLNNTIAAEKLFTQSLFKDPTNVQAILAAAKFQYLQKNYLEAEILYTRAESFENAQKPALLGRAQILIDLKDYQSALNLLRIAYRNYPELVDLKDNITILENTIQLQKL